tara:strand:- start:644 stop:1990 length:1347 start_codon:yes stop_codon:yes gene_type:complete
MQTLIKDLYEKFKKSSGISTDSRTLKKNNIFFSLRGDNFDGNDYANDALEKGASFCVIDNSDIAKNSEKFLFVRDSLNALQELAKFYRDKLNIPIIGITGSNGKTTTKNLIEVVLGAKYKVYATDGNYNNHIGVPLSILNIKDFHQIGVIEMGASSVGEIADLCQIAKPTCGLITNISKAHIKGFKSFEGVVRGKSELFDFLNKNGGQIIINNFDSTLANFIKRFDSAILIKGERSNIDVKICESKDGLKLYEPNIIFKAKNIATGLYEEKKSKLFGKYNFENILMAISVAKFFKINELESADKICFWDMPFNNRSQVVNVKGSNLILDAYNANPESMKNAIESIQNFSNNDKVFILGDMNELGEISQFEHTEIGKLTSKIKSSLCLFVGDKMEKAHKMNKNSKWFKTYNEMQHSISNMRLKNVDILVKGSRSLKLERVQSVLKKILI